MKKNIIICVLVFFLLFFLGILNYVTIRGDKARDYIKALERDFPEYIDTTSGSDAFNEYYNY